MWQINGIFIPIFILLYIPRHLKGLSFRRRRENPRINLDRKRYAVDNSTLQFLKQAKQYWNCLLKRGSLTPSLRKTMRSFNIYHGDGSENGKQEVNSRWFKLRIVRSYSTYSISFNLWSWRIFLELNLKDCIWVQEKKSYFFYLCSRPSYTEREIRKFHAVFVQQRQRNVNKREARVKVLFC